MRARSCHLRPPIFDRVSKPALVRVGSLVVARAVNCRLLSPQGQPRLHATAATLHCITCRPRRSFGSANGKMRPTVVPGGATLLEPPALPVARLKAFGTNTYVGSMPRGGRSGSPRTAAIMRPDSRTLLEEVAPQPAQEVDSLGHARHSPSLHHQVLQQEYTALPLSDTSELFPTSHMPRLDPLLLLYFPFGVALAGFRMLLWVVLLLADQPWLTDNDAAIAALQALLGVRVAWHGEHFLPQERHVLVSNHVTTGDLMALYRCRRRVTHLVSAGLPARVTQARNHRVDMQHASVQTYERLAAERGGADIHLFPEGGMTNGRGMMRFSRGFLRFADGLPVAPVALRASLPWGLSTHTLRSSFLANLFWFCFSPYVCLDLTVLPPVQRMQGESKARFVERVQQQIADELQIPVYDYTIMAKKHLIGRGQR